MGKTARQIVAKVFKERIRREAQEPIVRLWKTSDNLFIDTTIQYLVLPTLPHSVRKERGDIERVRMSPNWRAEPGDLLSFSHQKTLFVTKVTG